MNGGCRHLTCARNFFRTLPISKSSLIPAIIGELLYEIELGVLVSMHNTPPHTPSSLLPDGYLLASKISSWLLSSTRFFVKSYGHFLNSSIDHHKAIVELKIIVAIVFRASKNFSSQLLGICVLFFCPIKCKILKSTCLN